MRIGRVGSARSPKPKTPVIRRPLCWAGLIFFLCATLFCRLYPAGRWLFPICLLLGIGGLICLAFVRTRPLAGFFLAAILMLCYCFLFGKLAADPALSLSGRTVLLTGDVAEAGRSSFLLNGEAQDGQRLRVQVWCGTDMAPDRFQRFSGSVQLSAISSTDRFDSQSYYRSRGVYLQGQLVSGDFASPSSYPIRSWPGRLSDFLCKKVRAVLDVQYSGLVCAVILGNRSYLPSEQYQLFERLGVEHLLAVSGMHLTLFCGMFSLLAGRFVKRKSPRLLLSMGFVLFYMLLTGLGPSVSRAGIMLLLSYLAQLISRQADPPTSLGAAVFLMLLYNPFLAMNTSFQFSVCATIGVRILAEPLGEKLLSLKGKRAAPKLPVSFVKALCVAFCGYMSTLPLTMVYDGRLVPMAVPANLLLSPVFTPVLVFAAGLTLFSFVPFLGSAFAFCARFMIGVFLRLASLLAQIGPEPVHCSGSAPVICAFLLTAAVAYGALKRDRRRFAAALCLATVACGCSVSTQALVTSRQAVLYTAAFGKRLVQVISYGGHAVVLGHLSSEAQIEQTVLEPDRQGVSVIDALILLPTGGQPRVSFSGLTESFSVKAVLLSPSDNLSTQSAESLAGIDRYDYSAAVSFWQNGSIRLSPDGAAHLRIGAKKLLILPADCAILEEEKLCWDLVVTAWDTPPPVKASALFCARPFWGRENENPNAYLLSYGRGVRCRIPLE